MLKQLLCVVVFGATVTAASAEDAWSFRYTGFEAADTRQFAPDQDFAGSFAGADADGNSILDMNELDDFYFFDFHFVDRQGCGGSMCTLADFSYNLQSGTLAFSAYRSYGPDREGGPRYASWFIAGEGFYEGTDFSGAWAEHPVWLSTDQTRFAIDPPPPIPEPATAMMLGVGLSLVFLARLAKRNEEPPFWFPSRRGGGPAP